MALQELVEAAQVGEWDVDLRRGGRVGGRRGDGRRRRDRGQHLRPAGDGLGADLIGLRTELDGVTDASQGVFDEQLQDPRVPASAGRRAVLALPGRRGRRRSTRGVPSRGRPACGPARRACGSSVAR